jgi:hypothetical protein
MVKKSLQIQNGFFIAGKRASLLNIAESAGGETWKYYLETYGNVRKSTAQYLKSKLDDYLSANKIKSLTGIEPSTLNKWRKDGILKSEKINGRWYYSVITVLAAIKSEKT